jgi:hypothetical protein
LDQTIPIYTAQQNVLELNTTEVPLVTDLSHKLVLVDTLVDPVVNKPTTHQFSLTFLYQGY